MSSVRYQRTTCRGGGEPRTPQSPQGDPPDQRAPPTHGMQGRGGERGDNIPPEGEGGPPPEQAHTPFVRGLIQEMGGNPQDLISPPPPQDGARGRG